MLKCKCQISASMFTLSAFSQLKTAVQKLFTERRSGQPVLDDGCSEVTIVDTESMVTLVNDVIPSSSTASRFQTSSDNRHQGSRPTTMIYDFTVCSGRSGNSKISLTQALLGSRSFPQLITTNPLPKLSNRVKAGGPDLPA